MFGTEVTGMSIPTAIVLNIIPESAKNQKAAMDATETVWKKLLADVMGNMVKDCMTGQPRGFGFITYADPLVVDKVIQGTHVFGRKQVEIERTIPRETANSKGFKTKKIFVR
nr:heterogeneous nuclear ribonucleoprotein 1 [Tanacetum cinerariifolium]